MFRYLKQNLLQLRQELHRPWHHRTWLEIKLVVVFVVMVMVVVVGQLLLFLVQEQHIQEKRTEDFESIGYLPDHLEDKKLVGMSSYSRPVPIVKRSDEATATSSPSTTTSSPSTTTSSPSTASTTTSSPSTTTSSPSITSTTTSSPSTASTTSSPSTTGVISNNVDEQRFNASANGTTPGPANSSMPALDAHWSPVHNARHKFFVYSAYYDDRISKIIRVIAATLRVNGIKKVWCKYWYADSRSVVVAGATKIIREHHGKEYSAAYILCPLLAQRIAINGTESPTKQEIPPPRSVSVLTSPGGEATNNLTVQNLPAENKTARESFAVCVKPFHEYDNVNQLLEFIELYRILGVEHFTFYNHTISPQVSCILENYIDNNIVTLLPWKVDLKSKIEVHTENMFAALNDCLYRNMYRFKYVLMVDVDEFIISKRNETLPDLVKRLTKTQYKKKGGFNFQNAFFYLLWPDDPDSGDSLDLKTQRKTFRLQHLHPHNERSKYIVVNPRVVEAGNHFVWEFVPGHNMMIVPGKEALSQHYRKCEKGGDSCKDTPRVRDDSATRYKDRLEKAVRGQLEDLTAKCSLGDEHP